MTKTVFSSISGEKIAQNIIGNNNFGFHADNIK